MKIGTTDKKPDHDQSKLRSVHGSQLDQLNENRFYKLRRFKNVLSLLSNLTAGEVAEFAEQGLVEVTREELGSVFELLSEDMAQIIDD